MTCNYILRQSKFTPLGYLRIGPLAISLMTIPVVIGAMILGPAGGAVLGLVFGLTSFYQCFAGDSFGAALVAMNPFFTFLVCIPTRTLMGWLSGVIFKALWKIDKTKTVTYFVTGLLGAFMNTLFFMSNLIYSLALLLDFLYSTTGILLSCDHSIELSTLMICFGHTEYLQSMNATGANLFMFAVAFCGINGALEMPMSCVVGGGVAKAVSVALKKNAATEEK